MSRRWLVAAVVALGLAGWISWRLWSQGRDADAMPSSPVPGATEVVAPAPEGAHSRSGESGRPAIHPRGFSESGPVAGEADADAEVTNFSVILFPEHTPAGGAIVSFTALDSYDEFDLSKREEIVRAKSVEFVADSNGVARLPALKLGAIVRGRSGGRRGQIVVLKDQAPYALHLQAPIPVMVTNESGAPQAGVPVAIQNHHSPLRPIESAVTGRDGMAELWPPQPPPRGTQDSMVSVSLALPLPEAVEKLFDPERLPATPVGLVLPACGRVVVKLKHADGTAFTEAARVRIQSAADEDPAPFDEWGVPKLSAVAEGGAASFPLVPLAGNLEVRALPANLGLRRPKVEGPELEQKGGRATVTVPEQGPASVTVSPDPEAVRNLLEEK